MSLIIDDYQIKSGSNAGKYCVFVTSESGEPLYSLGAINTSQLHYLKKNKDVPGYIDQLVADLVEERADHEKRAGRGVRNWIWRMFHPIDKDCY
jgi:hypothetical protein